IGRANKTAHIYRRLHCPFSKSGRPQDYAATVILDGTGKNLVCCLLLEKKDDCERTRPFYLGRTVTLYIHLILRVADLHDWSLLNKQACQLNSFLQGATAIIT